MKSIYRGSLLLLLGAMIAAGSASGDPPPWARGNRPDRPDLYSKPDRPGDRRDDSARYGRPALTGTVTRDFRRGRYLEVRAGNETYRVDVSRADLRGASEGRLRRGTRVAVWGSVTRNRTVEASRVYVLDDNDDGDSWGGPGRPDPRQDPRDGWGERDARRLVGRVTRASSPTSHRDIRVDAAGSEWRVDVPSGTPVVRDGTGISVHELSQGDHVRISGERVDEGRFRADRIEVLPSAVGSGWSRPGTRPAEGTRYTGSIRSVDRRAFTFEIRSGFFDTHTVFVTETTRFLRDGRRAYFSDLREDSRVRVQGYADRNERRVEAVLVEIL